LTSDFSQNSILKGICSGTHRISIPMPFMTVRDHMPIVDVISPRAAQLNTNSASALQAIITVVSTALDVAPVIPITVFVRAGEDFQFLQPNAVGRGYTNNVLFEAQVGLPPIAETFETRAKQQKPTGQMIALDHVEDFMNIWSQALPYDSFAGSPARPFPDIKDSAQPCWWDPTLVQNKAFAVTPSVTNDYWVTLDYLNHFSSMFLYYRGSIGMKILCESGEPSAGRGYKYFALSSGQEFRQPGHDPYMQSAISGWQMQANGNLAYGCVATELQGQPVLEVTVPLRNIFEWGMVMPNQMETVLGGDFDNSEMDGIMSTNVILVGNNTTQSTTLYDLLYRKIGWDYSVAVRTLLPPPFLWITKGNNWV